MQHLDTVVDKLNLQKFAKIPLVQQASEKTGLKGEYLVLIVGSILAALTLFTATGRSILNSLIFFFYPAYKSFEALKTEQYADDKKWLTYWVVFGFLYAFDGLFHYFLGWMWGYSLIRIAVLAYVLHPALAGHEKVYNLMLKPFLDKYEENVDQYINKAEKELEKKLKEGKNYAGEKIADHLFKKE